MSDRRPVDRRAIFFWTSALTSLLLVLITPEEFKWVGQLLCVWLVLLGIASWLDDRSRHRRT